MLRNIALLATALTLGLWLTLASAAQPRTEEANAALDYIISLQNPDGGFPAFGDESTPGSTIDAVFALVAADVPPDGVPVDGPTAYDYLETQAATYATDPGAAAKLALAVSYVGVERLSDFGAVDLLSVMEDALDRDTGAYGLDLFDHAFYVFASLGAGDKPAPEAVDYLLHAQQADGGWEFTPGAGSDLNTTAMVVQALIAAGEQPGGEAAQDVFAYLRSAQNDDGGFGFLPGEDTDPNSTALAIQAVVAAGRDVEANPYLRNGNTPLAALAAFQNPATGAMQFFGEDSAFATYQAVPALLLAPFPGLVSQVFVPPGPPQPPIVDGVPAAPTTAATAALPAAGGGPTDGDGSWWPAALLLAGGALATGAAMARRRG